MSWTIGADKLTIVHACLGDTKGVDFSNRVTLVFTMNLRLKLVKKLAQEAKRSKQALVRLTLLSSTAPLLSKEEEELSPMIFLDFSMIL